MRVQNLRHSLFWLGMSFGTITAIGFMATCLVYVFIREDFSFFNFKIHQVHQNGYASIMEQYHYKYGELGFIEPVILLIVAIGLTSLITWASISSLKKLHKENTKHKLPRSKNTKKTQKHTEQSEALFV